MCLSLQVQKKLDEQNKAFDSQKVHLDRVSNKARALGESIVEKSKHINQLDDEMKDLKIQAEVSGIINQGEQKLHSWTENLNNISSFEEQIKFLKNAFITATNSNYRMKTKISEYEKMITEKENRHREDVKNIRRDIAKSNMDSKVNTASASSGASQQNGNEDIVRARKYSQIEAGRDCGLPSDRLMKRPKKAMTKFSLHTFNGSHKNKDIADSGIQKAATASKKDVSSTTSTLEKAKPSFRMNGSLLNRGGRNNILQ